MPDGGANSFLPRIQSVFYAIFDVQIGPKILYQVPEGLIGVSSSGLGSAVPSVPPTPSTEVPIAAPQPQPASGFASRNSSNPALLSPIEHRQPLSSPQKHQTPLFNFDSISRYIIPPSPLCGRLVTCSTTNHRVIGFPVELQGTKYKRNYLKYNLCFVFERSADLSCYQPIVRKVARVLTACEEEFSFLSQPQTLSTLHAILEQLYEDLNSYSETSIPIDSFNSIELKIFPFYPNPPKTKDWMVPLALINLTKRMEDNWDLTMKKICPFINGVNHVSRIAQLAQVEIGLAHQAISHLLYYQVIMMIDIFQYSNLYTLRRSIQWLADESHVKEECGPYVTIPGNSIPDWPHLLHLYSRMRAGKTVFEWMEAFDIQELGIDPRRFVSFGVIKGFLRRVHRWPILLSPDPSQTPIDTRTRKRGPSLSNASLIFPRYNSSPPAGLAIGNSSVEASSNPRWSTSSANLLTSSTSIPGGAVPGHNVSPDQSMIAGISAAPIAASSLPQDGQNTNNVVSVATQRARRASAAEKILEQLRNRDIQKSGGSPRNSWLPSSQQQTQHAKTSGGGDSQLSTTPTLTSVLASNQESPTRFGSGARNFPGSDSSGVTGTIGTAGVGYDTGNTTSGVAAGAMGPTNERSSNNRSRSRRPSLVSPPNPPPSPIANKLTLTPSRPRPPRSPSATNLVQMAQQQGQGQQQGPVPQPQAQSGLPPGGGGGGVGTMQGIIMQQPYYLHGHGGHPPELVPLLDGEHHTDDLCARFEVGWSILEQWLVAIGGGKGDGDYGRVTIIYR